MKVYNIAIGSDHAGYALKSKLITYLNVKNYSVLNCGTDSHEPVDYPDYANKVADSLIMEEAKIGILICGTGIGMSITANRKTWVRAALCTNQLMGEYARLHNDANILVLGSRITSDDLNIEILDKFLSTDFEGGRHSTRLAKIH